MAHWIANPVCFLNPVIPRPGPATGLKPSRVLVFGEANSVLRWLVPLYRPRFRGHRVDGNWLMHCVTGILGDTEIAAPLLKIDPRASTALVFNTGPVEVGHAARSKSCARTCAGV